MVRRKSRKGFELSIGMIVLITLSIIIFIASLVVLMQVFTQTETVEAVISQDTQRQIESLIGAGQSVAVVPSTLEIDRGKDAALGVGISNNEVNTKYYIVVNALTKAFAPDESELKIAESSGATQPKTITLSDKSNFDNWFLISASSIAIAGGERNIMRLRVGVPHTIELGTGAAKKTYNIPKGTFVYNICVLKYDKSTTLTKTLTAARAACREGKGPGTPPQQLYPNNKPYKVTVKVN